MKKAIFLDKDGTLIKNVPYNVNPGLVELAKDAGPALFSLSELGYEFFVISNQSGIARGFFTENELTAVFKQIAFILKEYGVTISQFYFCPHHPKGIIGKYTKECMCRKPSPGLLIQAAKEHNIDLSSSWMIGDTLTDIESGNKVGCQTILVNNGNETEWKFSPVNMPQYIVTSFDQITNVISFEHPNGDTYEKQLNV